jgi:hypothetical protein
MRDNRHLNGDTARIGENLRGVEEKCGNKSNMFIMVDSNRMVACPKLNLKRYSGWLSMKETNREGDKIK